MGTHCQFCKHREYWGGCYNDACIAANRFEPAMSPGKFAKEMILLKTHYEHDPEVCHQRRTIMDSIKDDLIRSINQKLIKEIQTEHERLVTEAFFFYGYTKDWIVRNVHRVGVRTFSLCPDYNSKTIYSVDKRDLFAIVDKVEFGGYPWDEFKANIMSHVEFIAED